MNATQPNKFIMAFLGVVFVVMTIGILSNSLYYSPLPEKPGFAIKAVEAPAAGGAAAAPKAIPIEALLQTADPKKGAVVFKRCLACHTGDKNGGNKVGPHLWGIVNRPAASVPDFSYSSAMKAFGAAGNKWTYEHLNTFLTLPKAFIKGTAMGFAGDKNDAERADLIAYLRTLSDNPPPLPAPPAAAPAAGAKPAAGAAPAPAGAKPAAAGAAPAAPAANGGKPAAGAPAQPAAPAAQPAPAPAAPAPTTQPAPAPAK